MRLDSGKKIKAIRIIELLGIIIVVNYLFFVVSGRIVYLPHDFIIFLKQKMYYKIIIIVLAYFQNILCSILLLYLRSFKSNYKKKLLIFFSSIVCVGVVAIAYRFAMINISNGTWGLPIVFELAMNTFFAVDIVYLLEGEEKQRIEDENLLYMQLLERDKLDIERVKKQYDDIRGLRHDMKHYIGIIQSLISEGKNEQAIEIIQSIYNNSTIYETVMYSDNHIINAILSEKKSRCDSLSIPLSINCTGKYEGRSELELGIILANLLDNAIEAEEKLNNNQCILVDIHQIKENYQISVRNYIEESVLYNNSELVTSKYDKNNHGLGTRSVKKLTSKIDGSIDFYEENKYFVAVLLV